MSSEAASETSADEDPDNVSQRPASNLLLAGTGLSLALAVSAVVGLSPTGSGSASPPGADQVRADRVAVADRAAADPAAPATSLLAIDPTGTGELTIDQVAAASAWSPPAPLGTADSLSPASLPTASLPIGSPSPAAAPKRPAVAFAPAGTTSVVAPGAATAGDAFTGTFGDGRMEPGNDASARSSAAGQGLGGGSAVAKAGNGSGGIAGGDNGDQSDGGSHAGNGPGSGGPGGPGGPAGAGDGAGPGGPGGPAGAGDGAGPGGPGGPGGDESGNGDGHGGPGGHGHGGHHGS